MASRRRPVLGRLARAGLSLVALAGLTCRDRSLTGPGLSVPARLSLAPNFPAPPEGAPQFTLRRVRAVLVPEGGEGTDSLVTTAAFEGDTAVLTFDVSLVDAAQRFTYRLAAVDESGDTLFRAGPDTISATAGTTNAFRDAQMRYAGPDARAMHIQIAPTGTTIAPLSINGGATQQLSVTGSDSSGGQLSKIHVGWTSREVNAAAVATDGKLTASMRQLTTWVIARTYTGIADSVLVTVQAPVASVAVVSPQSTVVRGDSIQVTANLFDVSTPPVRLTGRAVTWTSSNPTAVSVDANGWVKGGIARDSAWIIASSVPEGKKDSVKIKVDPRPVASVTASPDSVDVVIGQQLSLSANAYDATPALNPDFPIVWTTSDQTLATVASTGANTGVVSTLRLGRVVILATAGAAFDSVVVRVVPVPVASVVLSPATADVFTGDSVQLAAEARDASNQPLAGRAIVFSSLDAGVATVSQAGWVKGLTVGVARIVASVDGKADTSAVTVRSRYVLGIAPRTATAYSLGDTVVFQAGAGGQGNELPTFTWLSRDPSVLEFIDATGDMARFRALANGSTRVVVGEPGGTLDSATVLVQQRVASVNVTPSVVQRYLGTQQQFSATALDARGNPMTSATFAWSSSSNAVTIDASTGLAQMAALGAANVRATAGTGAEAVTGQAQVTVATAISRIVVTPATATLAALGATQGFTAEARDTLDAPMSGIAFTWESSNPSVAQIVSSTATAASARADANGLTAVRASAQGVTGEGRLTVQQVLASLVVTPSSAVIGAGGTLPLIVRGFDANGRQMAVSGAVWNSSVPGVATVNASTGVVTGVQVNQTPTNVTARVGNVTSNAAVVSVSNQVPARIYFGRDTIGIGRGTSQQIPIYLSAPSTTPVTVNLVSADTIAYFTVGSCNSTPTQGCALTIPANAGSANVTITGRNAGTSTLTATDPSGVYAQGSAAVSVQANVRFSFGGRSINNGDQFAGQVLLSDPAPQGGVYVTYAYGTAGIAQVSPDPAFIPTGNLAADVVVRGLAPGSTTITPSALGVSGASSPTITVSPAELRFYYGAARLGAGQQAPNGNFVYTPNAVTSPLTVTLTSTDSLIAKTQRTVTIPVGQNYAYVDLSGFTQGAVTITASAPKWTSTNTWPVVVTTPRLNLCCNQSLNTTSPPTSLSISTQDSTFGSHARINALVVQVTSDDPSVARVLDATATIQAGQTTVNGVRIQAMGGGTTWIRASAGQAGGSGYHFPDSVQVTVTGPALQIYYGPTTIGAGQFITNANFLYIPNAISTPLTVTITPRDSMIAAMPQTVIIPVGQNYAYYDIRGHRADTTTYTVSAPGYRSASSSVRVTTPRVGLSSNTSMPVYTQPVAVNVFARDSLNNEHGLLAPALVTLRLLDPNVIRLDYDTVTIAAGQSRNTVRRAEPIGVGTARVIAEVAGWFPDTITYTVTSAPLRVYYGPAVIAAGQSQTNGNFVYIPSARAQAVAVTVTQRHPEFLRLPATTLTIPADNNYSYFSWEGVAEGGDTLTFTAEGYDPTTYVIRVSRRLLEGNNLPANALTTASKYALRAWTHDTVGTSRPVTTPVTVRMRSTDETVLQLDEQYVRIEAGQQYTTYNYARFVNPGKARVIYEDSAGVMPSYTSNEVTVTGPSLRFYYGPATTGMRQRAVNVNFVYVDNNVASPLEVFLNTSDSTAAKPVAKVPRSVTIPAGSNYAFYSVDGGDTTGTVAIIASATGYQAASTSVQVGKPQFEISVPTSVYTTQPTSAITVIAQDQVGNERVVLDTVTISLSSSSPNVAAVDSSTITILRGASRHNGARMDYLSAGTTTLTATDTRPGVTTIQQYKPKSVEITVSTPPLQVYYGQLPLAVGQWRDNFVHIPHSATTPLTVTVTHTNASVADITTQDGRSTTLTIPAGQTYVYFRTQAKAEGTDNITFSVAGHTEARYTQVVSKGMLELSGWQGTIRVGQRQQLRLYVRNSAGNGGMALAAATAFTLGSNANLRFVDASGTPITEVTVPADRDYSDIFYVEGVTAGTGTATAAQANYTTLAASIAVTSSDVAQQATASRR
ncbi:MAG TPA: Ig-like domain-containing protein [Gemmatimonadaceae bacterium]|nr:Ig-like domain-containing protein [Gemmatimonadaceae bacterium]